MRFNRSVVGYTFPYDWLQVFHAGDWVESDAGYFVDAQQWGFHFPAGTAEGGGQQYRIIDPFPPVITPKTGLTT